MMESTSPALDVALAYHEAWTSHDLDKAMSFTGTTLVKSAPGAECVTVSEGKITYIRFVFDRAPFDAAHKNGG